MTPGIRRWLIIAAIVAVVAVIVLGDVLLFHAGWKVPGINVNWGWFLLGLILMVLVVVIVSIAPQLYKIYRFQKYFKAHEKQLQGLPALMQSGHTQEALLRFESVIKDAPESAYLFYMRAFFMQSAGKIPEALFSANKALALASKDTALAAHPAADRRQDGTTDDDRRVQGTTGRTAPLPRTPRPADARAPRKSRARA